MRLHHQYQCYLAQVLLGKKKKICFSHSKMTLISLQLVWILMGVKWAAYRICQNISFNQVKEASHIQSQLLPCSTRPYFSTLTVRRRREASWLSKLTSDFFPLQQWARQFRHKNKILWSPPAQHGYMDQYKPSSASFA